MKYIVKSHEMKEYDRDTSERIGIPSMVLMERAALAAADVLLETRRISGRVLVVAGAGNNGGDGLAVGRLLALKGKEVTFFMAGNPAKLSRETQMQVSILRNSGFSIQSNFDGEEYDIVIDALFGTGLSRNVEGKYLEIITKINNLGKRGAYVCSVDIPSGICADTGQILGNAVQADLTVSFAFAKRGHLLYPGRIYAGKLTVRDIGITSQSFLRGKPAAFCLEEGDVSGLLPKRRRDGNKGTFGKVLLFAGSSDMGGACILAGNGILRMGAGMVKIITPSCNREIVQKSFPEALLYTFDQAPCDKEVQKSMDWADVIVAGPGIGTGENARRLMEHALKAGKCPLVVDADGLNLIAADEKLRMLLAGYGKEKLIITPHPGELVRLAGTSMEEYQSSRETLICQLAEELNCVIAAKDAATIVMQAGRQEIYINTSGNDGMAAAGSGDVLAGMIGGMLAQKAPSFEAACLCVYLHGLAGEEASLKNGRRGMTASDLIKALPLLMRRLENNLEEEPKPWSCSGDRCFWQGGYDEQKR